jgi:glycosyltransferase involved in cell wall biosynthesis
MNILHVVPSLDQMDGGVIRAALELAVYGQEFGIRSEILGIGPLNIPGCKLSCEAIHSLPLDHPRSYRFSKHLKPWLRERVSGFEGIILHGLWLYPNWATYLVCKEKRQKYACFPHGMLDPWPVNGQGQLKRWKKHLYWRSREGKILDAADSIFFNTQRERTVASTTFRIHSHQRVVTPFGVSDTSKKLVEPSRPDLKLPPGHKSALFLGRVHPKKNVHFLIDAWLRADMPALWHLIIAGPIDKNYRQSLQELIHSKRCNIHMVGSVSEDDKTSLFQRAAWFLLPSKQENFGIAVLEAISHGCPVAVSNEVYLTDELHAQTEVLPLRDESWIEFMRTRMQDEVWRSALCKKDQELVLPRFAVKNIAQAWAATLHEVFTVTPQLEMNPVLSYEPGLEYV